MIPHIMTTTIQIKPIMITIIQIQAMELEECYLKIISEED